MSQQCFENKTKCKFVPRFLSLPPEFLEVEGGPWERGWTKCIESKHSYVLASLFSVSQIYFFTVDMYNGTPPDSHPVNAGISLLWTLNSGQNKSSVSHFLF